MIANVAISTGLQAIHLAILGNVGAGDGSADLRASHQAKRYCAEAGSIMTLVPRL